MGGFTPEKGLCSPCFQSPPCSRCPTRLSPGVCQDPSPRDIPTPKSPNCPLGRHGRVLGQCRERGAASPPPTPSCSRQGYQTGTTLVHFWLQSIPRKTCPGIFCMCWLIEEGGKSFRGCTVSPHPRVGPDGHENPPGQRCAARDLGRTRLDPAPAGVGEKAGRGRNVQERERSSTARRHPANPLYNGMRLLPAL